VGMQSSVEMKRLLVLLFAIAAAAQTPAPPGKLVDVGGYRVHLYCTGTGGPTVLVVGAGFSFDWALVQPEVARFTRVCTYDVSGTAWSDPGPKLTCRERVNEVHKLIGAARLSTPLVLVGLSIGGCVARLYAAEHAADVAGMVIVDHAFQPDPPPDPPPAEPGVTRPVLIYQAPITFTVEDISNFKQLPEQAQQLHRWAMSLKPKLPDWDDAEDCLKQLKGVPTLGNKPLVVVSTDNQARGYDRLQRELLALSTQSSQLYANRSIHAVEIDRPEVIVAAIRRVVDAIRIAALR